MLTPLSVVPTHQLRGVGTHLLEAAVAHANEMGAAVFLEGDWTYCGRRGFVSAVSLGLLRPSLRIPEPAFQGVTLTSTRHLLTTSPAHAHVGAVQAIVHVRLMMTHTPARWAIAAMTVQACHTSW